MGGARPKAVVEDKDGLRLAKFGRPDDRWNNARVEHAMLVLARRCGLDAANLRSHSPRILLDVQEAGRIINDMAECIGHLWHGIARAEGLSVDDCEKIRGAFVYPGFWPAAT